MKKLLLTLILACLCSFSIALSSALASHTADSVEVFEAIDEFLTSIPADYHRVGDTQALKDLMKRDNPLVIDVREPSEYADGHIPTAVNIPLRTISQNLNQIPKNRPVVLYCRSGYRTAMALTSLQLLGYDNVQSFTPSLAGWQAAGEPIEP